MNNNKEFLITGGARIGNSNVTWPFASLRIEDNILTLNASIFGYFIFTKEDIVSIDPCHGSFSKGIRIKHNLNDYNESIIFWTSEDFESVIIKIKDSGFYDNNYMSEKIISRQGTGRSPLKRIVAIIISCIWILSISYDLVNFILKIRSNPNFLKYSKHSLFVLPVPPLGLGVIIAFSTLICVSFILFFSKRFQEIFLIQGYKVKYLQGFLSFIIFTSIIMLLFVLILNNFLINWSGICFHC